MDSGGAPCCRSQLLTWRRGPALPLGALHHLLGHPLGAALLPLLLQQLLQLRPAGVEASLVGGAAGRHLLLLCRRRSRRRLPYLSDRTVGGLKKWQQDKIDEQEAVLVLTGSEPEPISKSPVIKE